MSTVAGTDTCELQQVLAKGRRAVLLEMMQERSLIKQMVLDRGVVEEQLPLMFHKVTAKMSIKKRRSSRSPAPRTSTPQQPVDFPVSSWKTPLDKAHKQAHSTVSSDPTLNILAAARSVMVNRLIALTTKDVDFQSPEQPKQMTPEDLAQINTLRSDISR